MPRIQQVFLLVWVCAVLQAEMITQISANPPSCIGLNGQEEEDCLDEQMHPNLKYVHEISRQLNGENTNSYWLQRSKEALRQRLMKTPNVGTAKNVILFLGDGMGLTTLAAARNVLGGEEQQLSFEVFPSVGLSKTYSVDKIVPDSACTATAYLCGVKGNYGTIGVNGNVQRYDCNAEQQRSHHVHSIAKWALDAGKAAGLVTTTRVTHASPAGVYAHTANRDWENDALLKKHCGEESELEDIAQQLIHGEVGSKLKVILGGGKSEFVDATLDDGRGYRNDKRNLIAEFVAQSVGNHYVETAAELSQANPLESKRLLGLFHESHMDFHLDAQSQAENTQPTLEEMTRKALEFLSNEENGYFLFIEGGRIDSAHHQTNARMALDETLEFSKAVALARSMTSEEDTLIVVTADHSHTFSFAGYQARGSDIFGIASGIGEDEKSYLPLSYANGPSFEQYFNTEKNSRRNPEKVLENKPQDIFPATAPLNSETHGGEDVAVYASGPWSQLFTGVYEQNTIPHMMAYAACLGDGIKACT